MGFNVLVWAKFTIHCILFLIFLIYFGIPSVERYQDKKVVVTSVNVKTENIPSPGITICTMNEQGNGFKNFNITPGVAIVRQVCKNETGQDIANCINNETFDFASSLKNVFLGVPHGTYSLDAIQEHVTPDFTHPSAGVCHTIAFGEPFGTRLMTDIIGVELNVENDYHLFVHDPNFFLINFNPSLPFTRISAPEDLDMILYKMTVTQRQNLNVPSKACNSDPSYAFNACIKDVLTKSIGCRLYWDRSTDTSSALCDQFEQYRYKKI